jgi:hypothetical protein
MATGFEVRGRVGRLVALALLTLAVSIPAVLAGRAPAGWQAAGTSSRDSGAVRITSNRIRDLYPGAKKKLVLTLHNRSRHIVVVRRVRVREIRTSRRGCAASRRNLRIRQPRAGAFRIPARSSRRVTALLAMPNTVANACERAVFSLRYTTETIRRRPG